jgi:hypothetical protein
MSGRRAIRTLAYSGSNATRTTEFFNSILRFPQRRASRRMLETLTRPHVAVAAVQAPQPTSVAKISSVRDEFLQAGHKSTKYFFLLISLHLTLILPRM